MVTEYLEPYQVQNDDGSLGGVMTEVIHALFRISGDTPKIKVMPWARAYRTALAEKNVLIYSISHTDERDSLFKWVGEVNTENMFFWGLKSEFPQQVYSIEKLKDYKIAMINHSNVASYLKSREFNNLHLITFEEQPLNMLYRQRIDLIIGRERSILKRAKNLNLNLSEITQVAELTDYKSALSIAFNKKSTPQLVERFRRAFLELKTSGELEKILLPLSTN